MCILKGGNLGGSRVTKGAVFVTFGLGALLHGGYYCMSLSSVLDKLMHPTMEQRLQVRKVRVTVLVADSFWLLQGAAEDPEGTEVPVELRDTRSPTRQRESSPLPRIPKRPALFKHEPHKQASMMGFF